MNSRNKLQVILNKKVSKQRQIHNKTSKKLKLSINRKYESFLHEKTFQIIYLRFSKTKISIKQWKLLRKKYIECTIYLNRLSK